MDSMKKYVAISLSECSLYIMLVTKFTFGLRGVVGYRAGLIII